MCAACHTAPTAHASPAPDALRTLAGLGYVRRRAKALNRSLTEEALTAEWRGVTVIKRAGEEPIRAAAAREFRREQEQVLAALDRISQSLVFPLDEWARAMAAEIGPGALAAIRAGFEAGAARVGMVDVLPFRPDDPRVRLPLNAILSKTRGISETTADALTRSLMQGVNGGESLEELAGRVREVFGQATGYRARTIAATSSTTAVESGMDYAFREAGIERRRWLAQRDGRARASHAGADGQERGIDEPFDIGGESLMYPGSPEGSASNTVNCRCSVLPLL